MNPMIIFRAAVILIIIGLGGWLFSGPSTKPAQQAETHEAEGLHELELTPGQIRNAQIKVEAAAPVTIHDSLTLYGPIMANGERSRDVAARYPGIVRRVLVKPGDSVKEGAVLAVVQSNESLQDYPLKAPIAGVVTARNTNPGEQTADRGLFMVTDLSTVWVELAVFPRDVAKVHVGQKARVRSADGGITAEGAVIYVAPVGNQASQARTVRVLLDNASGQWAPGLYVTADIALAETDVPVAIRNQAVQTLEGKDTVFVRTTKGFQPRPVHLGRRDATHSEVLEGLRPGETYATENSFILKAELGKGEAEHED